VIGDPRYYKVCKAMFMCDTPYATKSSTTEFRSNGIAKAKGS
jgi:peptide/nickel transport system substrate-binding protein